MSLIKVSESDIKYFDILDTDVLIDNITEENTEKDG